MIALSLVMDRGMMMPTHHQSPTPLTTTPMRKPTSLSEPDTRPLPAKAMPRKPISKWRTYKPDLAMQMAYEKCGPKRKFISMSSKYGK